MKSPRTTTNESDTWRDYFSHKNNDIMITNKIITARHVVHMKMMQVISILFPNHIFIKLIIYGIYIQYLYDRNGKLFFHMQTEQAL